VASALVNTMQQVGGSIGTAALSTVALTATATYLAAHHAAGPLASATAAVHGYTAAFAVSAALFGIGALVAVLLLPSRRRLEELRNMEPTASPVSSMNSPNRELSRSTLKSPHTTAGAPMLRTIRAKAPS
jgi:ABC-type uncharacterized transport system permease subunit